MFFCFFFNDLTFCLIDRKLREKELRELREELNLQLLKLQENIGTVRNVLSKLLKHPPPTPEKNQSTKSCLSDVSFKASICRLG